MPVVRTDSLLGGRAVYGHVITKFSQMGRLLHFLTHGAPLVRLARESSAIKFVMGITKKQCFSFEVSPCVCFCLLLAHTFTIIISRNSSWDVTKIYHCWVYSISRQGIEELGSSFGSIFLCPGVSQQLGGGGGVGIPGKQ